MESMEVTENRKVTAQDTQKTAGGETHRIQPCKGFAYAENFGKPGVFYGQSREEILGRIAEINSRRGVEGKYISLSLGKYDAETGDYGNYRRLDIMTGKDITPVYLELPRLNREEFTRTVAYLKENGAKFNTHRKQWYTTPDRAEQLNDYLAGRGNGSGKRHEEPVRDTYRTDMQEIPRKDPDKDPDTVSKGLKMIGSLGGEFVIGLRDGSTLHLDIQSIVARLGGEIMFNVDMERLAEELAAEVGQRTRLVEIDNDHTASVAEEPENRCTVCYTGRGEGEPPRVLEGSRLGVRFPEMDDGEIRSMAADWLARDQQYGIPEKKPEAEEPGDAWKGRTVEDRDGDPLPSYGDTVTMYVPVYEPFRSGEIITGVETVTGTLTKISEDPMIEGHYLYTLENSEGDCCISTGDSYSPAQAAFLGKIVGSIGKEEFDVLATPGLGMERMQAIYQGYREGLTADQAAYMADPSLADWRAEVWHQGMKNGLLCRDISSTLEYYEDDAEGCRKYLETLARDHRQEMLSDIKNHGYNPSPVILARIDRIRGMLQKDWKLSDICNAYRQRTYEAHPAGKEIDSLAGDFRKQEIARMPPVQER